MRLRNFSLTLLFIIFQFFGFEVKAGEWEPLALGEVGTGFRKVQFKGLHGWAVVSATDKGVVGRPSQDYILHTVNGGITWERLPIAVDQVILDLVFIDEREGWMIVGLWGNRNKLLHTTDGGRNWEEISYRTQDDIAPPGQPSLVKIHFFNASEGIAMFQNLRLIGGDLVVSRTENGGKTWVQKIFLKDITGGSWDFVGDNVWIAFHSSMVYSSPDRGIS